MKRTILPLALFASFAAAAFMGCASVPDPSSIPMDKTIIDLSQSGQEAIDANNYKAAEVYYQTIIDRYGTNDSARTSAEFEIAHMKLKKKNWTEARTMLEAIIARYETTGGSKLPPEYLVLAKNDLASIPAQKAAKPATDATQADAKAAAPAAASESAPAK